jgi:MoaA/NifB/PqqE/SkfB family radical SAM enzyme
LFRPDIYEIARYATDAGLPVALATNGTLIDDAVAARIQESGVKRVSISFDGVDAATHDAFRGLPGSFEAAIVGFKALRKAGLPVQINTTVANHNKAQRDGMLRLAKELDAVGLHLFLLVPVGCGVQIAEDQMISAQEYEGVLNWLYDMEQAEPALQLKATCAPHYFRVMRTRRAENVVRARRDLLRARLVANRYRMDRCTRRRRAVWLAQGFVLSHTGGKSSPAVICLSKREISISSLSRKSGRTTRCLQNYAIPMPSKASVGFASSNLCAAAAAPVRMD